MREQNIEVIRKACVAANPEIMELKFGCEMRCKGKMLRYIGKDNGSSALIVDDGSLLFVDAIGEVEILGHPIRLADVLEAARKVGYNSTEDWLAVITGIVTRYDLHKDSLTDQSDVCLAFLAALLK